jgi:hypothetical protein
MNGLACGLVALAYSTGLALEVSAQTAAPPPSAETLALARQVAAHDDFLALVQTAGTAEIAGIEKGLGDLTATEKAKVDEIGKAKLAEGQSRVIDKLAVVYAATFTPDQLRATAAFLETPAGGVYAGRLIKVLPGLGEGMKGFDFKREVLTATCAQIKKGCPATP